MRWLLTVTVGCLLIANALSKLAHTSKGNLRLKETSKHGDVKTHRRSWVRSSTDQDDISDVYEDPDQEDSQASKSSTGLGIVDEDSDSTAKVLQKALVGHLDYPIHTYPAAFHGDSHFDGAFLGHYDLGCHTTEDHCDSGISYPAHFHSGHIDCSPDVDLHCGHAITPVHHHHHLVHHTPALHVALSDYGVHGQLLSNQEVAKLGLNSKSYLKQLGLLGQGNGGAGSKHRHHADCHPPADIAFLFEGCANASQAHFERWVAFAKHLVHRLPPSHDGVHYGAAVYSDKGVVKFDFERAYHMRHVIEELNGVAQTKPNHSQCNLGDGLRATKADLFDRTSRDYVYQVLIIFSNGNSSDDPASHARELRDSTVNIFYIATKSGAGVNAINVTQMNDVATRLSVDHVFQVDIDDLVDHFTGRHADSRRGDRGNDLDDDAYADSDDDDDDGGDDDADGGRSAQAHRLHDHFNHLYDYIPWHRCVVDVTYVINTCKFGEDQQQKVRTFLKDASRSLQIGRNGDHVAVVTARQEATIQWDLSRTWSHRDLDAAIDGLDLKNGETNCAVGKALNKTLEGVFLTKNRDPRNEFFRWINVTVFVADHHSSDDFKAASQALRDHGIVVHTVQWGSLYTNKDYRESTAGIASRPSEFYVHAHESIERLTVVSRRLSQYFRELTIGRQGENYKRPHGSASDYLNYDHDRDHHDDYDDELDGRREGAGEGAAAGDGNLNWKNEYGFADGYMKSRRKGHRAGWSSRFSSSRFGSSSSSSGGESSSSGGSSTSGSSTSGSSTSGSSMSGSSTSGGRLAGGSVSASGSFSGGSSSLSASGSLSANGRLSSPRFSQNPSPQGDVQVDAGRFSQNQPKKSVVGVSKEVRGVARSRLPVRNAAGGGAGRSAKEPGIGVARSKLPVRNAAGGGGGRSAKEPGIGMSATHRRDRVTHVTGKSRMRSYRRTDTDVQTRSRGTTSACRDGRIDEGRGAVDSVYFETGPCHGNGEYWIERAIARARIPRPAPMYRRHADPTAFNGMTDDVMRAGLLMKRTNVRRGEVTIGSGSSRADQRGSVARDRRDQVSVTMMGKGGSPRRVV